MAKTQKQIVGNLGEGITVNYLKNKGFQITERNYWKPWGEIDIIAQKQGVIHFIEVKTVVRENLEFVSCGTKNKNKENNVSRETTKEDKIVEKIRKIRDLNKYRPEDNLHPWKLKRLSRVIQTYLLEKEDKNVPHETIWKFGVVVVYLNIKDKKVKVDYLEDIIL